MRAPLHTGCYMPKVRGHVEVQRELPQLSTCVECHRSYRPRSEDQACMDLCEECFESAKYPGERVVSVKVRPRVEPRKSDLPG
jgi:hypothetical protein